MIVSPLKVVPRFWTFSIDLTFFLCIKVSSSKLKTEEISYVHFRSPSPTNTIKLTIETGQVLFWVTLTNTPEVP